MTLRAITDAAGANVAAVSYHFGSLGALRRATIEEAIDALIGEQTERLQALDDDATVDDVAAALAQPIIAAHGNSQQFLRIVARVAATPSSDRQEWMDAQMTRSQAELLARLRRVCPGVSDDDLRFRGECVGGLLGSLATGSMRVDLEGKGTDELARLVVPVIAGVLTAGASARP